MHATQAAKARQIGQASYDRAWQVLQVGRLDEKAGWADGQGKHVRHIIQCNARQWKAREARLCMQGRVAQGKKTLGRKAGNV
jgi:hypothetical protein